MTKMLVTIAWGNYWEVFGERFEQECRALNTQPDRIVIVSDKPINTQYENVVLNANLYDPYILNVYRRKTVEICDCDWLIQHDIDDEMYPNYCDELQDDYDVHIFFMKMGEQVAHTFDKFSMPESHKLINSNHLPLGSWMNSAIKKSLLDKCNAYKLGFGWEDVVLACDILKNNGKIYAKERIYRGKICRTPGSVTSLDLKMSKQKHIETRAYFERLFK